MASRLRVTWILIFFNRFLLCIEGADCFKLILDFCMFSLLSVLGATCQIDHRKQTFTFDPRSAFDVRELTTTHLQSFVLTRGWQCELELPPCSSKEFLEMSSSGPALDHVESNETPESLWSRCFATDP